jgi:hypothetical protein
MKTMTELNQQLLAEKQKEIGALSSVVQTKKILIDEQADVKLLHE